MAEYKLVPEDIPPAGRRSASSAYTEMLDRFLSMKDASVRIEYDRKPSTIYISLKRAVKNDARYEGIKVSQRGQSVYLVKD